MARGPTGLGSAAMPLEEYRRKRDFSRTPEPRGGEGPSFPGWDALPAGWRFCVQMHRATRLHFDLRLEHAGVLLSWAVPKGPTLDPDQRRLAVHVEDHPVEYGGFEGVIPSGYGAGVVMLWDAGTLRWERETAEDVDASLRRGDLKFSLDGRKLHGEFALVRLGRRGRAASAATAGGDDKNWLLIKKRDERAQAGMNAVDLDWSVKTGRTLAQIAEQRDDTWHSDRQPAPGAAAVDGLAAILATAPEAPLPQRLEPMLATPVDRPFSAAGWLFELKYDGVRALATVRDGRVRLRGRRGRDETARFPEAAALSAALRVDDALVDGEMCALDEQGRPSFERLQQRINLGDRSQVERVREQVPATFVVFDMLAAAGHDLRGLPLATRKRALREALRDVAEVRFADHVETDGEALFGAIREKGLEGMVAKRASSVYEAGRRSTAWLKVKAWQTQDCVIVGFTAGRGGRAGLGALVLAVLVDGELVHAGQVGSGLGGAALRDLEERLHSMTVDSPPLRDVPHIAHAVTWARPELVCTVRFSEWTAQGTLRQSTFLGLRPDLTPDDCVRELPAAVDELTGAEDPPPAPAPLPPGAEPPRSATPGVSANRKLTGSRRHRQKLEDPLTLSDDVVESLVRLAAMDRDGPWDIGGRTLRLTNLDKPLWPEGITKRDMIAYYVRLSPLLLRHLRDRPLGMQVFPDGIEGKHFWRKRIPDHAPAWIRSWEWHGDKTVTYVVVDEVATLGWIANSAVIDLHPWHSRVTSPDQPDWAVFDLDPFPPATFEDVVRIARLVKAAVDHFGLRSHAKLSGQTGMQIYVPLRLGPDYAAVRGWVEEVSRAIGRIVPDKVSWEWEVARRTGRLRLDYTQNVIGKTLAAAYSLRPAPGAPVSAPIAWEELDDPGLRPDRWSIQTIEDRVRSVGDLFAGVLEGDQDLPA